MLWMLGMVVRPSIIYFQQFPRLYKQMFKLQICIAIILTLHLSHQITVESSSYCIGNCYRCQKNPFECTFEQSLLYPPNNNNCLPYSMGNSCRQVAFGLREVNQVGLAGWSGTGATALQNQTCTIFYQPPTTPKIQALGPLPGGSTITKTVQIAQQTVEAIVLKMSFTLKSSSVFTNESTSTPMTPPPAPQTNPDGEDQPPINPDGTVDAQARETTVGVNNTNKITNRTNRAFVDVRVTGPNINYVLQLNYPLVLQGDRSSVIDTSCGLNMQYVHSFLLNQSVVANNLLLKIEISSIGGADATWGLTKFEVYTGCGGLMIPSSGSLCGSCMNGYYPIIAQQNTLMGCAPCPPSCKTCTQDRCTLCYSHSQLNPTTNKCQLSFTYQNVTGQRLLQGFSIANIDNSTNYFYDLITTDNTNNAIILESQLASASPYSVRFYLIYNSDFIRSLNQRSVVIARREQILMTIPAEQFRTEIGLYDRRLPGDGSKYYVKSIYIDKFNEQNSQRNLEITVRTPSGSTPLYLSNYEVIQYQCAPRCSQCDKTTDICLQCSGFFVNRGPLSCVFCANGYYLKRVYENTNSSVSISKSQDDICVKCHSSCKQCVGPEMDQCSECFKLFYLDSISYNRTCIQCLYNAKNNPAEPIPETCNRCLDSHSPQLVFLSVNCTACIKDRKFEDVMTGELCQACWISNGLSSGRCIPTPASSLSFYGSDVSNGIVDEKSWTADTPLIKASCSADYKELWGVAGTNNSNMVTIRWNQKNLPPHTGLHVILNIYKTDIQILTNTNGTRTSQNIYIKVQNGINEKVELLNKRSGQSVTPGTSICGSDLNQMIHTYSYDAPKHKGQTFGIQISSEGGGIYVRQLEMYLGNCPSCAKNQLNYEVKYLPRYSYNNTVSSGLDVWIDFNKNVKIPNNTNLKDAFKFEINQLPNLKLDTIQFKNQLDLNNRLKYYIPLDDSFKNGTLKIRTSPDARIFGVNNNGLSTSRRLLINSPLNILQTEQLIHRFSKLSQDDLVSTNQIYWFYNFFQWFALITMIVCAFFGVGVVFQEFSILLQLLFLHVYISSSQLPATYKAPLVGLQRMENLNYFADPHAQSIEWQWFRDYQHPSPQVFQQYNKDILFERSFYPTIIINLIYLGWFIIMFICYKRINKFQTSSSYCVGLLRNIPARPLNYFDQIWRYQFITTMWSAFMQFHILKNDTAWERLNLALCFISFIISIAWPFFVVCYTYRLNSIKYSTDFMYKYEDIYYKKMQTISDNKIKYYYYVFIRFIRYFIMALFICVFTEHQIIAPVILICVNIIEIAYVVAMRVYYNSILGIVFKVAENLLFIGVEIALLFVYGLSDTATEKDFLNLGHALNVLYVIMIIIGLLRVAYLVYQKIKHFKYNMKIGMDNGEVVNIGPTPLPNTDRGEPANNVVV